MTLAELKRRIQVGTKMQSVFVGKPGTPADSPFYTTVGEVVKINSVGFYIERKAWKPGCTSFCDWPKASMLQGTSDGFRIMHPVRIDDVWLQYKWVE